MLNFLLRESPNWPLCLRDESVFNSSKLCSTGHLGFFALRWAAARALAFMRRMMIGFEVKGA